MDHRPRLRDLPWLDLLLALSIVASTGWLATHDERSLENALGVVSTQGLRDLDAHIRKMTRHLDGGRPTLSQIYGREYPRSPIAWLNRHPVMENVWKSCSDLHETTVPILMVASVCVGLIAVRRPARKGVRARWGPGRVAAGVSTLLASIVILEEYLLRRFDLMTRGDYHDTIFGSFRRDGAKVGMAIAAAWLVIYFGGRWKLGRGWREWLGVLLGTAWLADLVWELVLSPIAQL
jgi:hypothetical protein